MIKIRALFGLQIDEKDISISHRLPHKVQSETYSSRLRSSSATSNYSNRFPKIIVKFARRSVKYQFYPGCKDLKNKSTKDLGFLYHWMVISSFQKV